MADGTETAPNPTTPTPAALPDNATVEEVMQGGWMTALADDSAEPPVDPNARPRKEGDEVDKPDPDAPQPEASADDPDAPEPEPDDPDAPEAEPEPEAVVAEAPEFWSEEDKRVLAALPKDAQAAVAATVRKYEQQRIAFVNEQSRKAVEGVKEAREVATKLYEAVNEQAAWWQQVGPKLNEAFVDKWAAKLKEAGVASWAELANQDPGLWAKYEQERRDEAATLAEANRRGQEAVERAQAQQAKETRDRIMAQKAESHAALAKKYPKDFANPDEIYNKKIGPFLLEMGIDVDRINQISELPILEIAYMGYLYREGQKAKAQAQKTAAAVLDGRTRPNGAQPPNPASATPTRVAPGAPVRAANRQSEAVRQVSERFRKSGSVGDAAALIQTLRL